MYETLVRQHDAAIYQMPTIDDAIDKLKDIESRKRQRRVYQKQRAVEEKAQLANAANVKRKADELEAETPADSEVSEKKVKVEPVSTDDVMEAAGALAEESRIKAEPTDTEVAPAQTMVKAEPTESEDVHAPVQAEEDIEPAKAQTVAPKETSTDAPKESKVAEGKDNKSDWRSTSVEERRYLSTKPALQTRGHTSYLTFAFLMPEDKE